MIGASALVLEGTDVPPGSLVLGFPGKVVRQVDESMRSGSSTRGGTMLKKPSVTAPETIPY